MSDSKFSFEFSAYPTHTLIPVSKETLTLSTEITTLYDKVRELSASHPEVTIILDKRHSEPVDSTSFSCDAGNNPSIQINHSSAVDGALTVFTQPKARGGDTSCMFLQDSAMGQSVIKFHGAGNASVLLTDRFTHVDVPAQAAETLRSFVIHFGEPGLVEINKQFFENVKNDSEYAWGWFCNLACPLMDAGLTHEAANRAAARQLQHIFQIDITQHPHWADFETQWAAAKATPVQATVDTDATTNVSGKHWTQL